VRLGRELFLPALRDSYADTLAAVEGADLLVSQVPLAARLVAEKTGIAWASTIHIPLFFFSAHDLPVFPTLPGLTRRFRRLGPRFWGPVLSTAKWATRRLARPWDELRSELGLPPAHDHPLGDSHSPHLVLALFSGQFAEKQPDWPRQSVVTGFPFFDEGVGMPADLERFLDDGPPPIVFTMGTAVSNNAGRFYEDSVSAVKQLGSRAVLILNDSRNRPADLPKGVIAFDYAPFSKLFPRAAAIVHHGGIGTTGLVLRAGRPALVMPCAWDQPDNANRVVRLGVARSIPRHRFTARRAAGELSRLLGDTRYESRVREIAAQMRQEDGAKTACDALEELIRHPS
jgi:UDP:flavonoid glycosyltransferase YjiC (YdhE family)